MHLKKFCSIKCFPREICYLLGWIWLKKSKSWAEAGGVFKNCFLYTIVKTDDQSSRPEVLLNFSLNSQKNILCPISFLIKLQTGGVQLNKIFAGEIFKNLEFDECCSMMKIFSEKYFQRNHWVKSV